VPERPVSPLRALCLEPWRRQSPSAIYMMLEGLQLLHKRWLAIAHRTGVGSPLTVTQIALFFLVDSWFLPCRCNTGQV
jgi:hypothetical protein